MENPEKLLDLLSQDARLTPAQLAAMTGASEAEVVDAIRAFEKNATILGYKTVIDWDTTATESVTALIEVQTTPQKGMGFDELARQTYSHHPVDRVDLMSDGVALPVILQTLSNPRFARFASSPTPSFWKKTRCKPRPSGLICLIRAIRTICKWPMPARPARLPNVFIRS